MPNWCMTRIIFHGNKSEIEDLHSKIEEWTSNNLMANGFGPNWLGNILVGAGLGDRIDSEKDNRLRCRGSLEYMGDVTVESEDDAYFAIDTDTAWDPMVRMWDEVFKAIGYKTIGYSFQAEEPGMCLYLTYDPYGDFTGEKYYIDIFLEGDDKLNEKLTAIRDDRFFGTDEQLISTLQELLETDEDDVIILRRMAEKYPFKCEDSYISIYEYESVDKKDMC